MVILEKYEMRSKKSRVENIPQRGDGAATDIWEPSTKTAASKSAISGIFCREELCSRSVEQTEKDQSGLDRSSCRTPKLGGGRCL